MILRPIRRLRLLGWRVGGLQRSPSRWRWRDGWSLRIGACLILFSVPALSLAPHPPGWLKAYLAPAAQFPAGYARGILLLRETRLRVRRNGHIRGRYRLIYRILRPQGHGLATYAYTESPTDHIRHFRAWEVPGQGHAIRLRRKQALTINPWLDYPGFMDSYELVQRLPRPQPGAVVAFDIRDREQPDILEHDWLFQEDVPVVEDRLVLRLPRGWEYQATWRHWPVQAPRRLPDGRLVWELHHVPAWRSEPLMPPSADVAASMSLVLLPPRALGPLSPTSWQAVGGWYSRLTHGLRQPTPDIIARVTALTRGRSTLDARVEAVAEYVQRQIRYLSIDIGKVGGYRPHPAAEVLRHGYGDCKDKATLLMAMLRVLGVQAHYVLLNHQRGVIHNDAASLRGFDHAIVAIVWPATLPADSLYAFRTVSGMGRLLFFDPTYDNTPWGWLPAGEQGGQALIVSQGSGTLARLPVLPSTLNRRLRSGAFIMLSNGSLTGKLDEVRYGNYANRGIEWLHMSPLRRSRWLNARFSRILPGTEIRDWQGNDQDGTVLLSYSLIISPYLQISGANAVLQPWILPFSAPRLHESHPRKYPLWLGVERSKSDVYKILLAKNLQLMPGASLPAPLNLALRPPGAPSQPPYMSYSSQIRWQTTPQGPVLRLQRTLMIYALSLPASEFPALRRFWQSIRADEDQRLLLRIRPAKPAAPGPAASAAPPSTPAGASRRQ